MELMRRGRSLAGNGMRRNRPTGVFGYGFATVQNPAWTLSQVLLATGGRFLAGRTDAVFRSISTDSRTIEAGDLFVALAGENFDGHAYVGEAVKRGAAGVVVSRPPAEKLPVPVVLVEDTQRALGDLAAYRRALMPDLTVVAITGSSGKTTVKEMVATILAEEYNVLKTKGNFNNLVGLPLSLLPVAYRHDFAVLEMGMNRPGEISRLTEIADPDIACITNAQDAHLLGLDDINGVARAKGELFAGTKAWGTLVVNLDDKRLRRLAGGHGHRKITFGRSREALVRATHIRGLGEDGTSFTLYVGPDKARVTMKCLGAHNVMNALAAAAIARAAGLGFEEIVAGIAAFIPYEKRMQIEKLANGLRLVNDTYNANPASMMAALSTVRDLKQNRKAVAILGDMLELGKQSLAAHRLVGESVARLGFDYLLAVGEYAGVMVKAARGAGMGTRTAREYVDKQEIVAWLKRKMDLGELEAADWILVKGSRGMRMETIIEGLGG